jgi:hypothetical protein
MVSSADHYGYAGRFPDLLNGDIDFTPKGTGHQASVELEGANRAPPVAPSHRRRGDD